MKGVKAMSYDPYLAPPPQQQDVVKSSSSNGLAIAGFVLSLLGVLLSFIPIINILGCVLAFLGLIFGIIGLVMAGGKGSGKGLSIAAIILALLAFVITAVVSIAAFAFLDTAVNELESSRNDAAPVAGKIGEPVKDGDFTFVVQSVKCGLTTSGGSIPATPNGEYCAVDLTVTNRGEDSQIFASSFVQGFIGATKYEADSAASTLANPGAAGFADSIKPGDSIQAKVLIDVPAGEQLEKVELHDFIISGGTSVDVR